MNEPIHGDRTFDLGMQSRMRRIATAFEELNRYLDGVNLSNLDMDTLLQAAGLVSGFASGLEKIGEALAHTSRLIEQAKSGARTSTRREFEQLDT